MEIRRARPDDADGIEMIENESFGDPFQKKDIFGYICSESGMCFTATDESGVVGYVIGTKIPPEGEIYRIAVRPDKRQRGIGYRLLSYALKTELGHGVETVFLEVRSKNIAAIALYRAYGFKEIGVRKNYYQNPTDDAIIMLKDGKCC
jgi:ribosomal-protein-alanine N-acetyltransferase